MKLRLNKVLANRGIAARRKCDELIERGAVQVNGRVVDRPGAHVDPDHDDIRVQGKRLPGLSAPRYFVLNKPVGMISTLSDPEGRRSLREVMPPGARVFPVGRLDADTSGLILLTNDGDLAHHLMHPRYGVEKLYRVVLRDPPVARQLERLQRGVVFEPGVKSAPARVRERNPVARGSVIEIGIAEGRYHQVRRMCEVVGLDVVALHRWGYGPLRLGDLERGMWRELSEEELRLLKAVSARPKERPASIKRPPARRRGMPRTEGPVQRPEGDRSRTDEETTAWPGLPGDEGGLGGDFFEGEEPVTKPRSGAARGAVRDEAPRPRGGGAQARVRGEATGPRRSEGVRPLRRVGSRPEAGDGTRPGGGEGRGPRRGVGDRPARASSPTPRSEGAVRPGREEFRRPKRWEGMHSPGKTGGRAQRDDAPRSRRADAPPRRRGDVPARSRADAPPRSRGDAPARRQSDAPRGGRSTTSRSSRGEVRGTVRSAPQRKGRSQPKPGARGRRAPGAERDAERRFGVLPRDQSRTRGGPARGRTASGRAQGRAGRPGDSGRNRPVSPGRRAGVSNPQRPAAARRAGTRPGRTGRARRKG